MQKPNVVFLLTDQWRLQAMGYAGNVQVQTPNIDRLAGESVNFRYAISGYSVCCPLARELPHRAISADARRDRQ